MTDSHESSSIPEWLSSFATSLQCSPDFIREMDRQLRMQFSEVTGLDIDSGFHLLNPFPEPFQIVTAETGFTVKADLVGRKMGYPVEISWEAAVDGRDIRPEDGIAKDEIRFRWSCLDAAEIAAEEAVKSESSFDTHNFSFVIEKSLIVWPHISLEIKFKTRLQEGSSRFFQELLIKAQQEWNHGKDRGIIHLISEVQYVNGNCLQIRIDSGSAGPDGLEYILRQIAEKVKGIITIRISSY